MKKEFKIVIISICVIIALTLCIYICIKPKLITSDEFISNSKKLGYSCLKTNETISSTAIEFWKAQKDGYEINFHATMSNIEKRAKKSITDKHFEEIKEEYENLKSPSSKEEYSSFNNFSKYSLTTEEFYIKVTKIDNTIMFAKVPIQYKDEIINFFEQLGY